jgi:DNA polymerase
MQFKGWLHDHGYPMEKLGKELVMDKVANDADMPKDVREALTLRLTLSNTSTKKYEMMDRAHTNDGRLHGLLQFYGANRTGRWAGRLLQVQNLPRNYIQPLSLARDLVKAQDADSIEMLYDSVPGVLKELIRTALVPAEGCRFLVADFSAIEARVIAWYAHEDWTLEAFRTHGKIYEATASQMFDIPLEDIDKKTRQKGKVATLALGYQGGPGALKAMGALKMGIPEDELPELVTKWRDANPNIVRFWYAVQKAAMSTINHGKQRTVGPLVFTTKDGWLFVQLPSGRKLAYAHARTQPGKFADEIVYDGQGEHVGFTKLHTYGGKLVENIVQATARDLLAGAMLNLEKAGYPAVFHIHDEVIVEKPDGEGSLDEMVKIMTRVPNWAEGLPLNAAGFETKYYMKN